MPPAKLALWQLKLGLLPSTTVSLYSDDPSHVLSSLPPGWLPLAAIWSCARAGEALPLRLGCVASPARGVCREGVARAREVLGWQLGSPPSSCRDVGSSMQSCVPDFDWALHDFFELKGERAGLRVAWDLPDMKRAEGGASELKRVGMSGRLEGLEQAQVCVSVCTCTCVSVCARACVCMHTISVCIHERMHNIMSFKDLQHMGTECAGWKWAFMSSVAALFDDLNCGG